MKIPFKEKVSDAGMAITKPLVKMLMARELTVVSTGEVITKDHEPFILIANQFNSWDNVVVMNNVKTKIRFLTTINRFLDPSKDFKMKFLAKAIPKQGINSDYLEKKAIYDYLAMGYSIGFFPEGESSFYGETLQIIKSTGKLIKKAGVDVIIVKQQGGYLSQPRWADNYSTNGHVQTKTFTLLTKTEIESLKPEEINELVEIAIANNDYDFQRKKMLKFKRKARAEGIERLIYYCDNCGGVLTVFGKGDDIVCSKCGKIGHINEYEFIEGNKFDNLVDYNKFQYSKIEEVINSEFVFVVTLNLVNYMRMKNIKLGDYKVRYKDKKLYLSDNLSSYVFELEKMQFPVNTMDSSFSFDYEEDTYNFTNIRHQFVLFEMCRYLNKRHEE